MSGHWHVDDLIASDLYRPLLSLGGHISQNVVAIEYMSTTVGRGQRLRFEPLWSLYM